MSALGGKADMPQGAYRQGLRGLDCSENDAWRCRRPDPKIEPVQERRSNHCANKGSFTNSLSPATVRKNPYRPAPDRSDQHIDGKGPSRRFRIIRSAKSIRHKSRCRARPPGEPRLCGSSKQAFGAKEQIIQTNNDYICR